MIANAVCAKPCSYLVPIDSMTYRPFSLPPSEPEALLASKRGGGTYDGMEPRVAKLEADMTDIKVLLGRIDERTSAMASNAASKADLAEMETRLVGKIGAVETRVGVVEGALGRTLGVWQFIGVMAVAVGLITQWPRIVAITGG